MQNAGPLLRNSPYAQNKLSEIDELSPTLKSKSPSPERSHVSFILEHTFMICYGKLLF